MFFIEDVYCDHWAEILDIRGLRDRYPIYNADVIHHMMNHIADRPLFAVIATDDFGGVGDQHAGVYRGTEEIDPATA